MRHPLDAALGLSPEQAAALGPERADWVSIFRQVGSAAHAFRLLFDQRLRPEGLTYQQAALLTVVRSLGRPTLGEVAIVMLVSHQNVKQIARPLLDRGLLRLLSSPEDGRVRRLATTPANERFWAARDPDDLEWLAPCFAGLDRAEAAALAAALGKLRAGLRAQLGREAAAGSTPLATGLRPSATTLRAKRPKVPARSRGR